MGEKQTHSTDFRTGRKGIPTHGKEGVRWQAEEAEKPKPGRLWPIRSKMSCPRHPRCSRTKAKIVIIRQTINIIVLNARAGQGASDGDSGSYAKNELKKEVGHEERNPTTNRMPYVRASRLLPDTVQ